MFAIICIRKHFIWNGFITFYVFIYTYICTSFTLKRAILLKNRSKHYLWIESWRRNPSARLLSDQDRISKLRPFISHVPRLEPRTSAFFLRCKVQLAVPSKSSQDLVVVMKFEFCAHSARLLRKLDHVFLWILSNNTGLWQCSIEKSIAMFCLYTLPLARPAQAEIQMLTTSSWIVKILLKSLLESWGLYHLS